MLRWLDPRKDSAEPPDHHDTDGVRLTTSSSSTTTIPSIIHHNSHSGHVTDDPLAILESGYQKNNGQHQKIYSVSRSVLLPRVVLSKTNSTVNSALGANNNNCGLIGGGVNPIFQDNSARKFYEKSSHPGFNSKSNSSGYGGSHTSEHFYLEQNPNYIKSIKVPKSSKNKSVPSSSGDGSGSSGGGTLTTIPEGRVDLPIPKPIWPLDDKLLNQYDSLVDDALLFYTSLNYNSEPSKYLESYIDLSVKDLLLELLNSINASLDGKTDGTPSPEETLKIVNEKIRLKLESFKNSTDEEMRKLCVNLSNCRKINSVLKAFSNSSSSGISSQSFTEWNNCSRRVRTFSTENEDLYHIPSASSSSSSGFSGDSLKESPTNNNNLNMLPVFVHDDIVNVPNGLRNAMIYGTLYRAKADKLLLEKISKHVQSTKNSAPPHKKSLIRAVNDNKPSVWQQYYGVKAIETVEGDFKYMRKPTDVPLFPGGRPEADFTLDVPRSELLLKKMRDDKKWRCRCRLLTSFLGLVFFLLSVMAVSLILTRGKRMFGSMV